MRGRWSAILQGAAVLCLCVSVVLHAGCSRLDFSREMVHNPLTDVLDSGEPYVEGGRLDVETRKKRFEKVLEQWGQAGSREARDYYLGPGDVVNIAILALEAPDRTSSFGRTIGQDGQVSLPYVGNVRASGFTVRELEEEIKSAYEGKYLKNPQVTVNIETYQSVAVVMTGAVGRPGVYYLEENTSTVLEMLAKAGGLSAEAAGEILVIRSARGEPRPKKIGLKDGLAGDGEGATTDKIVTAEQSIPIELKQLIDEGDLRVNIEVRGGDILTVPSSRRQYIYVLGYVARPGAFEVRGGQDIDALRALAMAGGLSPMGRADRSSLLREENGRQKVTALDLIKMARGVRPLVYLEPGDTLIVGTSFLARATEIVRPSVGLGASYSPVP